MTARPLPISAVPSTSPTSSTGRPLPEFTWPQIIHRAPKMAATMARYLDQLAVSARPATVAAVDLTLRQFAHCVTVADPTCRSMAGVTRIHFEDYKRWLAPGGPPAAPCHRR